MATAGNSIRRQGGIGTPFKPGQSGNKSGRPKSNLNKLLSVHLAGRDLPDRATREQKLAEIVTKMALDGDMQAIVFVWERMEGKIVQPLSGPDGSAVPLMITLSDDRGADGPK